MTGVLYDLGGHAKLRNCRATHGDRRVRTAKKKTKPAPFQTKQTIGVGGKGLFTTTLQNIVLMTEGLHCRDTTVLTVQEATFYGETKRRRAGM